MGKQRAALKLWRVHPKDFGPVGWEPRLWLRHPLGTGAFLQVRNLSIPGHSTAPEPLAWRASSRGKDCLLGLEQGVSLLATAQADGPRTRCLLLSLEGGSPQGPAGRCSHQVPLLCLPFEQPSGLSSAMQVWPYLCCTGGRGALASLPHLKRTPVTL